MIQKNLDAVSKVDIDSLVANQVREGRTIEYKKLLPGNSDEEKKEFLADVTSFANGSGGDIIFGVSAVDGIPQKADGMSVNCDAEILRLESIIRDGVEPRIQGIHVRAVKGFPSGDVIFIRVPRSWSAPHMITFKSPSRFFTRSSNGKYPMDITEIRSVFLHSGALPERMRQFRDERIGRIIADETPLPLQNKARLILHILPVASFSSGLRMDVALFKENVVNMPPIGTNGWNDRFNLDGFATYSRGDGNGKMRAYCQIFRTGQIEAVSSETLYEIEKVPHISISAHERDVIDAVSKYLALMRILEIPAPVSIFLAMTGVAGACISQGYRHRHAINPVDRDVLSLPDVIVEDYSSIVGHADVAKLLQPVFDAVWNACGYARSYNYDEKGNWSIR
ncbi:MAG TPA: hypothetical protein DET40_24745 [Lentisphaeria bacterium]|nr:MAG: hypothetical protein A2X45_01260 [Lentisphaerae bacterium GWF2_50_93]HCE46769.1 hypothetical protein [Lentisphaeria bacterium]